MKAICPNNSEHKEFSVTAHVTQEWAVDENGNFQDCICDCIDVTHKPDSDDLWYCRVCNAEAIVTN